MDEKQIEKKVVFEDLDSIFCCPSCCPSCGIDLLKFERYNEFYEAKYCPECGQKLKWK